MRTALVISSILFVACGTPIPSGGSGGGGGTTASRCNTTNCMGCCDASDICQLGQSATACGSGGNACLACGTGLTCANATCVASMGTGGGTGTGGGGGSSGPKRVFVTATQYNGNLRAAGGGTSGPAGGDALCNIAAQAAGVGGTWVAWLSGSSVRAFDRVTSTGPWLLMGTSTVVFNNKANLATLPLVAIDRNENGVVDPASAWTGTANGGGPSGQSCSDWASNSSASAGTFGYSSSTEGGSKWTVWSTDWCNEVKSLICFEL